MSLRKSVKRVAALGTGAILVGASILGASAADLGMYPTQYISDGKFVGVMVVGDKAAAEDVIGVSDIAISLQAAAVTKAGSAGSTTSVSIDGEAWKAGTSTRTLEMCEDDGTVNIGTDCEAIASITSSSYIDDAELPNLLADGSTTNSKGTAKYEQRLYFEDTGSGYVQFTEDDQDVSADFLLFISGKQIARYEMEFTTAMESDVDDSTGSADTTGLFLTDFEDMGLDIMGSPFTIVTAKRTSATGTNAELILMGGSTRDTLLEGDTKTYNIDGKDFEVTLNFVDSDEAQFLVNGESTQKINDGDTDILSDGTTLGVSDILYQDFAGGIHSATFFIGANKMELKDTDINTVGTGETSLKINEETIDDAEVRIEGTDDNSTFKIDRISVNMTADDDFYVPAGGRLSENPDLDEPEVIFTQGWDIRYEGLSAASSVNLIKIRASGSDDYELEFVDSNGNTAKVPILHTPSGGNLKFGDNDDDLIIAEGTIISKDDYFIMTDDSDDLGERPSFALRYRGSDKSTDEDPLLKFDDLGSGDRIERPISVASAGTTFTMRGNISENGLGDGPGSENTLTVNKVGELKLGGATFNVYNASTHESDDMDVVVDLDASGGLANQAVALTTKYGAEINLSNTTNGVIVSIATLNTDHYDDLAPTAFSFNLTATSGEVRAAETSAHTFVTPTDDDDNAYAYSTYGAKAQFYSPSSDPNEVTIWYPTEQSVPLVYVMSTGASVTKTETVGSNDPVVVNRIDVGATKLASEVPNINAVNSILVGGPCANAGAATVMGNPADCTAGFEPGVGRVQMFDVGSGNVAMLVAGYSALDTRNAAQVVANYNSYSSQMKGDHVEVRKVNNQLTVAAPAPKVMEDDDSGDEEA